MQVADKNRDSKSIGALAVICAVLQLALAPNLGLGNGRANFAMIFSACIALMVGGKRGVLAGFFSGLFFDLSTTGPIGLMTLCLTVSSYVLGLEERNRMAGDLGASLASFAVASLVVSFAYHFMMLVVGDASSIIDVVIYRTLPTWALTFVFFLPFAYYFSRVRTSGPNLGGGGHFTKRSL